MTSTLKFLPVHQYSSQSLIFASAFLAIFLAIALLWLGRRRGASRGNTVLLVGPSDAGKTAILSTLVDNRTHRTHTSIQPNSSMISVNPASPPSIRLVDIPGHPRIREQVAEYLPQAKGVVFVVDASTLSRAGAAVAEHLHHLFHALTSLSVSQSVPPVLILAHKTDLLKSTGGTPSSTAITRVRTILARELSKRRLAQTSAVKVEGLGEEGQGLSEMGGLECEGSQNEFDWDKWEGGEVEFASTWVKVNEGGEKDEHEESEDGLKGLKKWVEDLT